MKWYEFFGKNIKDFAKLNNKTIGEVEKELGLSRGYISRIMSGKVNPQLELVMKVADTLGITIDALINKECFSHELKELKKAELQKQIADLEAELHDLR